MLTGAMTAAAEMIHVTQPAISRLVRDLEAELGFALFRRRGNLLVPTTEAQALLQEVERSFVGLQRIQEFARELQAGRAGWLKVAALPAMVTFLPRFVAGFARTRPHLKIFVDSIPSATIREDLLNGRLDIGVTATPFRSDALRETALRDTALVAIPAGHALAERPTIEAQDLAGEDLVLLGKFSRDFRHPVALELQGVPAGRVTETSLSTIACVMVQEGGVLAIVDPFAASDFVGKGVVFRPFKPTLAIGTALVRSSERPLSIVAQEFHDAFLQHVRQFLDRPELFHGP